MEEAASLFGPADSASDPFGSIVTSGRDDPASSSAPPLSEPPLSETREADNGNDWYHGSTGYYQTEGPEHPEYDWPSGGDTGDHYNTQPHYGGSTSSGYTYYQQQNLHAGDNLQYRAAHDAGQVYGAQQHYELDAEQSSLERSFVPQSSDGSSGDSTSSSSLHVRATHVQLATSDPYRPATQPPPTGGDSSMYPKPPLSSPYDRAPAYAAYQPVATSSHSAPQPGYQPYSAHSPLPPQVAHTHLGSKDRQPNPSHATALYRPKTSNAYDPPIPPPKPSRHVSGALGSSRVFSPTSATQTYTAQDAHVPYHTNPSELPPPSRHAPQTFVPTPPVATHPPSNPQLAANVSPPRREPRSLVAHGSSTRAEPSVDNSPYSVKREPEASYHPRSSFEHTWPQHVPSMNGLAKNISSNQHGYPASVQHENEALSLNRVDNHQIYPGQRRESLARVPGPDTSLSGGQYSQPDIGGGFIRHPTTHSNYSPEVTRSTPASIHTSTQESPGYAPTLERVHSPGSSSVHSARSTRSRDLASPPLSSIAAGSAPYAPVSVGRSAESGPIVSRGSSPASIRSLKSPRAPSYDPYAPAHNTESFSLTARDRSMSNSSLVSSRSSVTSDPYVPSRLGQNSSEVPMSASLHQPSRVPVHDIDQSHGQTLILPAQTHAPYAPSPSLLGSNDPLGRTSSRAPVVSFGFGGKLVLCFHGSDTLNTGFDVALSSRQTTGIQMRPLHEAIPESALDHISTSFPGPLFCDPGSPTGLVRPAVATQSKNNKAKVIKYLEGRVAEISHGLGYLSQGSSEYRRAEGKVTLVKLLKVLLEHDGHLSGSPQVETAVRAVLVPRHSDVTGLEQSTSPNTALYGLDGGATSLSLSAFDPHDRVLSVQTVKASALDKIQELLAQGERKAAYRFALDERLWAHAMIIASSIDKESWKEVVNEFIRSELNAQGVADATGPGHRDKAASGTGREPLKVAYSLYSGQGAACIQALVPPTSLTKMGDKLQPPALSHITPISPNFSHTTAHVPVDALKKWQDTAAVLIPGPSVTECSTALLALGDCLLANHLVEAAHACYLLAPQSTILGNIGSSGRMTLVGSLSPTATPNFHVSDDAIIFSEIVEFALSLATPSKGQEPFHGLHHLQAYKFVRAASLAEMGHMLAASRYCEAIAACLNRSQTLPHPVLTEQLREITDRLVGAPHLDKTGSWIRGKMTRPSLDSLGNWLGGRLTEFVAGGEDSPTSNGDITPHENKTFAGPFSHYSTITSTTNSKVPSPQPTPQPTIGNHYAPADAQNKVPRRTGSAQAVRLNPQVQIDRALSAMEYRPTHRNSSPTPRIASANAATTHFFQARSNYSGYAQANAANGRLEDESSDGDLRASPWWGSSSMSTEDSSAATPTVTMFPGDSSSSPSGFVSLMDAPPIPTSSVPSRSPSLATHDEDDDDDLGLGNSSSKRKATINDSDTNDSSAPDSKAAETDTQPRPESKSSQQSPGWFSRWWKKEGSSAPIKATLGEESSFVYDKDLKRWVNKKAGAGVTQPAAPPPPPSRAQTTSPGYSAQRIPNGVSLAPPPARAASAIDLTASPPKRMVPRPRSALPPTTDGIASGTLSPGSRMTDSPSPGPSGSPTPPPSRPRSQATKRNIRSRYVDVFQQPNAET